MTSPQTQRRVAVVAQPAGVHGRRHEVVAERVHRHQRRQPDRVAEVVARRRRASASGRRPARRRRSASCASPRSTRRRNGNVSPPKFEPPPTQPIDDVGLLAGHLHLRDRLLADHRLVQQHVVEHRAERVVACRASCAATSTASEIAIPSEPVGCALWERPASVRSRRRAVDGRAPGLHHRAAVGLLVVARADHPHLALEPEQLAGERQRRAPLAGAGLGRELA